MTSRRFLSLAAACVIGTMALAVPTPPVQAAPTSANHHRAVASVAPQTDAVSGSQPGLVPQRSRAHEALPLPRRKRKQRPGLRDDFGDYLYRPVRLERIQPSQA